MRNPLSAIIQCANEITTIMHEFKGISGQVKVPGSVIANIIDSSETISLCAEHQNRIISDVLTFSKIESNMLQISPTSVHVLDTVNSVVKMFERELRADAFKWSVVLHSSFQQYGIEKVLCDPSRVTQIFINILTNVSASL